MRGEGSRCMGVGKKFWNLGSSLGLLEFPSSAGSRSNAVHSQCVNVRE